LPQEVKAVFVRSQRRLDWVKECAANEITDAERQTALRVLCEKRVALFVVAYNAERLVESVVRRVPEEILDGFAEIILIDDSSTDATFEVAQRLRTELESTVLNVYRTPFNRGYGGNQKLGYLYCIRKGYDFVVLLHGDGQYAPEYLPRVLAALDEPSDAVFASRMLERKRALKGGMPIHKWVGNQILTGFGNAVLGTRLSEFHSGFRAYRVSSLARIPFTYNSDGFHFDTEIIAQGAQSSWKISEVTIPTYYGEEVCHVPGLLYARHFVTSLIKSRLVPLGIFYQRNFDIEPPENEKYLFKQSPHSLHQFVLASPELQAARSTIELGAYRGILSSRIADRVSSHVAVDLEEPDLAGGAEVAAIDLEGRFAQHFGGRIFDVCVSLDVMEHVHNPEDFLDEVFKLMEPHGRLLLSTANVGYFVVRLALLAGQFNYGKRGILDLTHKRLFTLKTGRRLLAQHGFKIEQVYGFPPPLVDLLNPSSGMRFLEAVHARLSRWFPRLFAFNILFVASRMDSVD
jgi:glycosyltransferase involved in cell wall biosynthesis